VVADYAARAAQARAAASNRVGLDTECDVQSKADGCSEQRRSRAIPSGALAATADRASQNPGRSSMRSQHSRNGLRQAPTKPTAAAVALGQRPGGLLPANGTAANPLMCVDRAAYLHDMSLASDTTTAVLSDLPSTDADNDLLPCNDADQTWQLA
jgi:hypothetical protein